MLKWIAREAVLLFLTHRGTIPFMSYTADWSPCDNWQLSHMNWSERNSRHISYMLPLYEKGIKTMEHLNVMDIVTDQM